MELKRNIYQNLLDWKKNNVGHLLMFNGTRYVGKTYILKKFGQENFKHVTYINLAEISGQYFCKCLGNYEACKAQGMGTDFLGALKLYDIDFVNDEETLVIIDEVQEAPFLYNCLRNSIKQNGAYIICAGSYINKEIMSNFLQISEHMDNITMKPLTFQEFFECLKEKELCELVSQAGKLQKSAYEKIIEYYNIYQSIGGYPEAVISYLKEKDTEKCQRILRDYTRVWGYEIRRYVVDIRENSYLEKVFHMVALLMIQNKANKQELAEGIVDIIGSGKENVELVIKTINLLEEIGIIGFDAEKEGNQYYFCDIGIANYYLSRTGATKTEIEEVLLTVLNIEKVYNHKKYKESLEEMSDPILISQCPEIGIDMRGMMAYAKSQRKMVVQLTDYEKRRFVQICE